MGVGVGAVDDVIMELGISTSELTSSDVATLLTELVEPLTELIELLSYLLVATLDTSSVISLFGLQLVSINIVANKTETVLIIFN